MIKPTKIILAYHGIGDNDKFLEVSESAFKQQINYLKDKGFIFLHINDLLTFKKKAISLVFDDGLSSIIKVEGFLKEKQIKFGVSLTSDKLEDNNNDYLKVKDLLRFDKCEFYSHGKTHCDLINISKSKLQEELIISKQIIEEKIGQKINTFVYPFGKYNISIVEAVKDSGYNIGLSLLPFHFSSLSNKLILPRININSFIGMIRFKFFISQFGNIYLYMAFLKRRIFRQNYLKM